MKSLTWTRESHGLFDYESKSIKKRDIKAEESGVLIWKEDNVTFHPQMPPGVANEADTTVLLTINQNSNWKGKSHSHLDQFQISGNPMNHANDWLWLVIRSMKEWGYTIKRNDIIKLGRMKFKVKEFRTKHEFYNSEEDPDSEFSEIRKVDDSDPEEKSHVCRFCWCDTDTEDNPKVTACNCSGTVKYIHF